MDRNTITGLILIFLIFIGFSVYNSSRTNKMIEKALVTAEAEYARGDLEAARTEYVNILRIKPTEPVALARVSEINSKLGSIPGNQKSDSLAVKQTNSATGVNNSQGTQGTQTEINQYGVFAQSAVGQNDFITLENNKIELKISLKGGRVYSAHLKDYKTFDAKPLILFSGDSTVFGFNFFTTDNKAVQTNNLYFKPVSDQKAYNVVSRPESVVLRLSAGEDKYIEYKYTLAPDKYMVDFNVNFKSMDGIIASNQNSLTLDWKMYIPQQEKGRQNEENYSDVTYKFYQDDVTYLKQRQSKESEKVDVTTKLSWVAFQDQFFSSVIVSNDFFLNGAMSSNRTIASKKYLRYYTSEVGIPFGAGTSNSVNMKLYYGPNSIPILKKEAPQLEKIVFLGRNIIGWISRFAIIPIFNWLNRFMSNFGLIILILTIIIKVVLFPLTFKSVSYTHLR